MKHNYSFFLFSVLALVAINGNSQVQTRIITPKEFFSILGHNKVDDAKIITLPALDLKKIKNEDAEDVKKGLSQRFARAILLSK